MEQSEEGAEILLAFDGSPQSSEAIGCAAHLLGTDRRMIVFSVWEPRLMDIDLLQTEHTKITETKGLGHIRSSDIQAARQLTQAVADHGTRLAREEGFDARGEIACGGHSVAAEIIQALGDYEAEVLVIGSKRHSGMASALLGSTVQTLLHKAVTPILVARNPVG